MDENAPQIDIRWGDSGSTTATADATGSNTVKMTSSDLIYVTDRGQPRVWVASLLSALRLPRAGAGAISVGYARFVFYIGAGQVMQTINVPSYVFPFGPVYTSSYQFPASAVRCRFEGELTFLTAPPGDTAGFEISAICAPIFPYSAPESRRDLASRGYRG